MKKDLRGHVVVSKTFLLIMPVSDVWAEGGLEENRIKLIIVFHLWNSFDVV